MLALNQGITAENCHGLDEMKLVIEELI